MIKLHSIFFVKSIIMNQTPECEKYFQILNEYRKDQDRRVLYRWAAFVQGIGSLNNNIDAETKSILDLSFQQCLLSRVERIESQLTQKKSNDSSK